MAKRGLRSFLLVVAAVLTLAAPAVAATALSQRKFVTEANGVCIVISNRLSAIRAAEPSQPTETDNFQFLIKVAGTEQAAYVALSTLSPPPNMAARYHLMLSELKTWVQVTDAVASDGLLASTADSEAAAFGHEGNYAAGYRELAIADRAIAAEKKALTQRANLTNEIASAATELGLSYCA